VCVYVCVYRGCRSVCMSCVRCVDVGVCEGGGGLKCAACVMRV
jgi:hypothetical protein